MPFCPKCGNQFRTGDNFCMTCGSTLHRPAEIQPPGLASLPKSVPYHIPLNRVLLMTVLSYGLYLFYWFYLTWKQYRDHTGGQVYPIWHALTLLVPIYGLFRTHAHARLFKELLVDANVQNSIGPGWAVLLVLVSSILQWISFQLGGGFTEFATLTQGSANLIALLDISAIVLVAGLLTHIQSNLNRYWQSMSEYHITSVRLGIGEVIFAIIGLLIWLSTLANILSESWRTGF